MNPPYPQYPQQPAPPQKSGMPVWAIVLIVVVLFVIAIIGILAALAIHGVHRYTTLSKTAEATSSVNSMASDAEREYEADAKICDSASSPVPKSITDVKGKKYMSSPTDWTADSTKNAGFSCIKFEMSFPQYYQYDYKKTGADGFQAIAHGDLDGNGVTSEFSMSGKVTGGVVTLEPLVKIREEE